MTEDTPDYLTTREVADLLRVKERKVYDLAAADEIPHRRITGKLLFPAGEIRRWIEGAATDAARPSVVVGSHDPLLDWAIRESGSGLSTLYDGSGDGLARFAAGEAALAGLHLAEADGWNRAAVRAAAPANAVLIGFAARSRGFMLRRGEAAVTSFANLEGRRVAIRQPGAGATLLFDRLLAESRLPHDRFETLPSPARTETEAAAAVASGEADVAFGLRSVAGQFSLDFHAVIDEHFDLLIDRRAYFEPPLVTLMAFARTRPFDDKAARLGGYDLARLGEIVWNAP